MILETLKELNISYKQVSHAPFYTMEDAQKIESLIKGQMCKNLFLRNKQNYYILVLKGNKRANLKQISKELGISHLYFGTDSELEKLNLYTGCVNPLSIAYDTENRVTVLLDSELENLLLLFHPNDNTITVSIDYRDLLNYLEYYHHEYKLLKI